MWLNIVLTVLLTSLNKIMIKWKLKFIKNYQKQTLFKSYIQETYLKYYYLCPITVVTHTHL